MRTGIVFLAVLLAGKAAAMGENLKVRVEGDRLRLSGPVHFLVGRPLERLQNGAVVSFVLQLTVRSERAGRVLAHLTERFTFSYDLWEEKFAVTRQGTPARSASNLSTATSEAWCLDNLSLAITQVPADRPFWIALEYESEENKDSAKSDASTVIASMIDIFSRRSRDEQQVRGTSESGPFRLDELRKKR